MIRVLRSHPAPSVLTSKGAARTRDLCHRFDCGEREFTFSETIYRHNEVLQALSAMQNGNCAFCERHVGISEGEVEHYRPKGSVQQGRDEKPEKPGYYWLAFEWDNLLLSCHECNATHKRILFPLNDPTKRARSHRDSLTDEDPLLIDPSTGDDPETLIGWRGEIAYPIADDPRAKATIEILRLNSRDGLTEPRRQYLRRLLELATLRKLAEVKGNHEWVAQLDESLIRLSRGPFQAMTRAFLRRSQSR